MSDATEELEPTFAELMETFYQQREQFEQEFGGKDEPTNNNTD